MPIDFVNENAIAESLNNILKGEFYLDQTFTNMVH